MDLCPYAAPHKSPAASQAARKIPNWNRRFITWFLLSLVRLRRRTPRTGQFGQGVEFRDDVIILEDRQVTNHAKIRICRNLARLHRLDHMAYHRRIHRA